MERLYCWLKSALMDIIFLGILLLLLWKIGSLLIQKPDDLTEWLLVYLTGAYAWMTMRIALASVASAKAAERSAIAAIISAQAMKRSVKEARMTRWAQFAASIQLEDAESYVQNSDGTATIAILNVFERPVEDLHVYIWQTETGSTGDREVKYCSMIQSKPQNIMATDQRVSITLRDFGSSESERRNKGELALEYFKVVYDKSPEHSLCLITFRDRASEQGLRAQVYDLSPLKTGDE